MEAITAIGLASSIVGFVDLSNRILSRIEEYHSSAKELPRVYRDISTQLPLMTEAMIQIENRLRRGSLSPESQKLLSRNVEGCRGSISELNKLLENILPVSSDSQCRKMQKALASIRKEKEVAQIREKLKGYASTFTLYFNSEIFRTASASAGGEYIQTYYEVPPLQVSHYVERVDLIRAIEEGLGGTAGGEGRQRLVVLLGMGGSGKTQLALEYCRIAKLSGRFKAILWIDASSPTATARDFDLISHKLNIVGRYFKDIVEKIDFVKNTLGSWEQPWLMVFDNFDQPKAFKDSGIHKYFPPTGVTGKIIVTSRNHDCERLGVAVRLTQMTEEESLELLLMQSKNERNGENLTAGKEIVMKLGYLPLAVDQAAAYISARKIPLSQFIKHYNERKEVVLKTTPSLWEYRKKLSDHEAETSLSVFTTFELSFQYIGHRKKERRIIEHVLTLSAFINAGNVSEKLFHTYIHHASRLPCWIRHFLRKGEWDHYIFEDALAELSSLSLLQIRQSENSELNLSLHSLVAEWVRLRTNKKQQYIIEAADILAVCIMAEDPDTMSFPARQSMISHIDSWVQSDKEFLRGLGDYNVTSLNFPAREFGACYRAAGRYLDAEKMSTRALKGSERAHGSGHELTLEMATTLGILYEAMGRWGDSETQYKRALVGYEKLYGPNHKWTLGAVTNLGVLYLNQGKLEQAEYQFVRAAEGYYKILGKSLKQIDVWRWMVIAFRNLGSLYIKQGKLDKAEMCLQQALDLREPLAGTDHVLTLSIVLDLANIYVKQDKIDEAEKMYKRILDKEKDTIVPQYDVTLLAIEEMGKLYIKRAELDKAEKMYQKLLMIKEKQLGLDHESTLRTVYDLGHLYLDEGKIDETEEKYRRALEGCDRTLGPDHSSTLALVNNLAHVYFGNGKIPAAVAMFERGLKGDEKQLGHNDGKTLDKVKHLRDLYKAQGEVTKMQEMEHWLQEAGVVEEGSLGDAIEDEASVQNSAADANSVDNAA